MTLQGRLLVAGSVLAVALTGWLVLVEQALGMDMGGGTGLAALGWLIAFWTTMTAAMMLPSAAPTVVLVSSVRGRLDALAFVAAYVVAWCGAGLAAYGGYRALGFVTSWGATGPWAVGAALLV